MHRAPSLWRNLPVLTAAAFLAFISLLVLRSTLRRRASTIAELVGDPYRDRFWLALDALLIALARATHWALIFGFNGWLLQGSLEVANFSAAVGHGLIYLATSVFALEFHRQVSREKGLAAVHFKWSDQARTVLHRNLGWLRFFLYPTSLLLGITELQPADLIDDAPGRGLFLLDLLVVTLFLSRLLHPSRGVLGVYLGETRHSWRWRLRYLWIPLIITVPVALQILVLLGYYFTATHLYWRFGYTFWSVLSACGSWQRPSSCFP